MMYAVLAASTSVGPRVAAAQTNPFQKEGAAEADEESRAEADSRQVAGMVTKLDVPAGTVTLDTGTEAVAMRATPYQIVQLKPGERFTAELATFGGACWLMSNRDRASGGQFGETAHVTGTVESIDEADGILVLTAGQDTVRIVAHPAALQSLLPGQFVRVHYQRVGNTAWATAIGPSTGVHRSVN